MPGAPPLRRPSTHARHETSLRKTLSRSAWNRRPGSALPPGTAHAARREPGPRDPCPDGEANRNGTPRAPLQLPTHRRRSGPSLTGGCVSARLDRYYGRLRLPPGTTRPLPGVNRRQDPPPDGAITAAYRAGKGRPVPAVTLGTFRTPYAGEFSRLHSRLYTASMASALISGAGLPCPTRNMDL